MFRQGKPRETSAHARIIHDIYFSILIEIVNRVIDVTHLCLRQTDLVSLFYNKINNIYEGEKKKKARKLMNENILIVNKQFLIE